MEIDMSGGTAMYFFKTKVGCGGGYVGIKEAVVAGIQTGMPFSVHEDSTQNEPVILMPNMEMIKKSAFYKEAMGYVQG